ncbi:MAG: hypothetical protein LBS68_00280 [Puniceicoccales bacterium]|jgi:hypothetical protein|nr:hypothetical protein [Puniceicoccales bacterium]
MFPACATYEKIHSGGGPQPPAPSRHGHLQHCHDQNFIEAAFSFASSFGIGGILLFFGIIFVGQSLVLGIVLIALGVVGLALTLVFLYFEERQTEDPQSPG